MTRRSGAVLLAVASALMAAACSSTPSTPQEPLLPGTAPVVTSHVVPTSPAAAARKAASQTATSTTHKVAPTHRPTPTTGRKATPTSKATPTVSGAIRGGEFCPANAHGAIGHNSTGDAYICEQPQSGARWRWLELPMWQSQHPSHTTTKG